jgi:hypothetical protein
MTERRVSEDWRLEHWDKGHRHLSLIPVDRPRSGVVHDEINCTYCGATVHCVVRSDRLRLWRGINQMVWVFLGPLMLMGADGVVLFTLDHAHLTRLVDILAFPLGIAVFGLSSFFVRNIETASSGIKIKRLKHHSVGHLIDPFTPKLGESYSP